MTHNNIDIVGVGDKKILPLTDDKRFCSLDEYWIIAKKTISAYAPHIRVGLAEEMLNNEDAIANIAHAIMIADWQFDGRGDIHGFRKQRIKWAIKSYVGRSHKRHTKNPTYSLDVMNPRSYRNNQHYETYASNLPDDSDTPAEIADKNESIMHLNKLLGARIISDKATKYIQLYYLEGKSLADIAKDYGVSRQSVHDMITRSLATLREAALNDNFFRGIIN